MTTNKNGKYFTMTPNPVPAYRKVFNYKDRTSGLYLYSASGETIPLTTVSCLTEALIIAAQTDTSWVVDSRYAVTCDVRDLPWEALPDAKVSIFKVQSPPWGFDGERVGTTNLRDAYLGHGGVYYLGPKLKDILRYHPNTMAFLRSRGDDTYNRVDDVVASTRRFPYPIRILSSEKHEPEHLAETLLTKLRLGFGDLADIQIVRTDLSIRDAHAKVVNDITTAQSVLFVDSDFCPNEKFFTGISEVPIEDEKYVHLWLVESACNNNVYGHGAPKLINKTAFAVKESSYGETTPEVNPDMTMAIGAGLTVHKVCVGTHRYDWSAESTWRTAFREGYKLYVASRTVKAGVPEEESTRIMVEAATRLTEWATRPGKGEHGDLAALGALRGSRAAVEGLDPSAINDYTFLKNLFSNFT